MAGIISSEAVFTKGFLKRRGTVLTGGCFDLLHFGHIQFLSHSRKLGKRLIVLLESDEFIMRTKNRKPFHRQQERATILSSLRFIDKVICISRLFTDNDYSLLIGKILPDVITCTEHDPLMEKKQKHALVVHAKLIALPKYPFSSSKILKYAVIHRD